jgi:DNA-binding protein Fis
MNRIQQDSQAIIGMTQPQDVFNPEVMAAGNSGQKLAMALGPNQIIQDNAVRNSADGLKEAIYLVWRTLIQYGDDYGVRKLAKKCHPEGVAEFLDYKEWDNMNVFERKQIHIELALGMMSDENRMGRQELIQKAQMGYVAQIQGLQQQGIFDMVLIEKIKKPFADTLYALGVKDADTYLPSNEEVQAMIQKAEQRAQQQQQQAQQNPPAEELYKKSQAALNQAKTQQIAAELQGADPDTQLNYMAIAMGKAQDYGH